MIHPLRPPIQKTPAQSSTTTCPHTLHFAPCALHSHLQTCTPHSSSSRAWAHPTIRGRKCDVCTGTTSAPSSPRVHRHGIVCQRLGMRTRLLWVQIAILMGICTSVLLLLLCLPLLRWLLLPSIEQALLTATPDLNNGLQVFYTTQEHAMDFLKDPEPCIATVHNAPAEERHQARNGQAGNDWVISHHGRFRTFMPLEEPHSHLHTRSSASSDSGENRVPHSSSRTRMI